MTAELAPRFTQLTRQVGVILRELVDLADTHGYELPGQARLAAALLQPGEPTPSATLPTGIQEERP